jgi:hypothetical protein
MATAVQQQSFSTQQLLHSAAGDQLRIGVLNSKSLADGIHPVYLQGKLYRITDKRRGEPHVACAISLLNNLKYEPESTLQVLKQDKRIGALHVQGGEIQSLTLAPEQLQMMKDQGVKEIAFKVGHFVLRTKDKMILREYTSDKEYAHFTQLF